MSAQPARHLQLVEVDENGEFKKVDSRELAELQTALRKAQEDLKLAERDLVTKRRQLAEKERDKVRERLEHPQRELIVRVCRYWWRRIHNENPRMNPLTPCRFDAVAALVELEELVTEPVPGKKRPKKTRRWLFQMEHFKGAIDGAAHEPYSNTLKSGKVEAYNDLTTIFKNADSVRRHLGRCPYEVVPILPARVPPGEELAIQGVTRNNPSTVPSQGPASTGPGGFTYGQECPVGGGAGRVTVRGQAVGLLVHRWLAVGDPGQPAA